MKKIISKIGDSGVFGVLPLNCHMMVAIIAPLANPKTNKIVA
ncbi:hypothetical protein [Pseudomonas frederiksbergensis]|nr:hypothetical protein [Pseudomonas frederiksbergensis]